MNDDNLRLPPQPARAPQPGDQTPLGPLDDGLVVRLTEGSMAVVEWPGEFLENVDGEPLGMTANTKHWIKANKDGIGIEPWSEADD